jgi:hypothetical protein
VSELSDCGRFHVAQACYTFSHCQSVPTLLMPASTTIIFG